MLGFCSGKKPQHLDGLLSQEANSSAINLPLNDRAKIKQLKSLFR
jgi:hypothetical protein